MTPRVCRRPSRGPAVLPGPGRAAAVRTAAPRSGRHPALSQGDCALQGLASGGVSQWSPARVVRRVRVRPCTSRCAWRACACERGSARRVSWAAPTAAVAPLLQPGPVAAGASSPPRRCGACPVPPPPGVITDRMTAPAKRRTAAVHDAGGETRSQARLRAAARRAAARVARREALGVGSGAAAGPSHPRQAERAAWSSARACRHPLILRLMAASTAAYCGLSRQ